MSNARTIAAASETLALCAATWPDNLATLAATIDASAGAPEWLQMVPFGEIKPNDGRTGWSLAPANADAVIAASRKPGLIDFDHGTQLGNNSRAAGWIEEIAKQGPHGEPGVWARVKWTADGAAALAAKSYRFFSPTFFFDKARAITKFVGGSLVNNPAIDDLPALASTQQENALDHFLAKLRQLLGLPDTATADDITAKISQMNTSATACAALNTRFTAICAAAGIAFDAAKFGDTEQLALCTRLTTPGGDEIALLRSQVNELNTTIVTMRGDGAKATAEQKVTLAIAAGKITPAQRPWALAYAAENPAKFDELMGVTPAILASGRRAPEGNPEEVLSDEDIALCSQLNIKPEDFKATRKARKEAE